MSGNTQRVDEDKLIKNFTNDNDYVVVKQLTNKNSSWSAIGYDKVVVCGGDGTLNHAINMCENSTVRHLIYVATGTFNETAQNRKLQSKLGKLGDELFSYVAAAGSLTEIGYATKNSHKKKHKIFAYFAQILKYYKVHNFEVQLDVNNTTYKDNVTLLMFLNSNRCFGFKFNKMYTQNDDKLYFLMVKSFGKNTLLNKIRLFFPLFRIFFLGIRKPIYTDKIIFDKFDTATVSLTTPKAFAVDGEKSVAGGRFTVQPIYPSYKLDILTPKDLK